MSAPLGAANPCTLRTQRGIDFTSVSPWISAAASPYNQDGKSQSEEYLNEYKGEGIRSRAPKGGVELRRTAHI
jgi:hypothetical protein